MSTATGEIFWDTKGVYRISWNADESLDEIQHTFSGHPQHPPNNCPIRRNSAKLHNNFCQLTSAFVTPPMAPTKLLAFFKKDDKKESTPAST